MHQLKTTPKNVSKDVQTNLSSRILYISGILIVLISGAFYIFFTWNYHYAQADKRVVDLAESASSFIPAHLITQMQATSFNTLRSPEYEQLRAGLISFCETNYIANRAYLYSQTDGELMVLVDSELDDSSELNIFEQLKTADTSIYKIPYTNNTSLITMPITDQRGTWKKVLIPIVDSQINQVIAVLGIDYPIQYWYQQANYNTIPAVGTFLCIFITLIVFYIMLKKNRDLQSLSRQLENSRELLLNDIQSRMEVEKALFESERNKAVLLSHLPGMAYRCNYDENWTMQFISDGCLGLTGYPPESLLNNNELSFNDIISWEYQQEIRLEWKKVVALKTKFKYEYEIITASGERKWVLEQGQPIYDENGEVEALEGIIIDINDLKLRESQIKYMNDHDFLTGLYNRQYFETAKQKYDTDDYLPLSIITMDINGVRIINDAFGHAAGDFLIAETANIIKECCRNCGIAARIGGDEFGLLLLKTDNHTARKIADNIKITCDTYNKYTHNDMFNINLSLGLGTKTLAIEELDQIEKMAEEQMYNSKLLNRQSSHSAILSSIMATLYARSQETEEHSQRIAHLSKMIGLRLNLTEESLNDLELLAMLHDIGKVGIDDNILNKAGPLNDDEWAIMKKHPEIGYKIAMSVVELEPIARYILYHHERWDGTGYPQGIKGESIPLLSRILAVADAFDAMTEGRVYRKGITAEDALKEIKRNAGSQFDPSIVTIFLDIMLN